MQITILGLPGSGKSTLARKIAERLRIPYIHLDRFWKEGGGGHNSLTTPDPERTHAHMRVKVLEAIQQESWVSDGGYSLIQPEIAKRADTMIFLDVPLWRRLINHAKRTIRSVDGHGELTFWSNMQFFIELIQPDLRSTAKIEAFLKEFEGKKVVLRSRNECNKYLQSLG
jgi:adenylate kinase family enzyme